MLVSLLVIDVVGISVLWWLDVRKQPTLYVLLGVFLVPAMIPGTLVQALDEFGLEPAVEWWWIAPFDLVLPALVLGLALWAGLHLRRTRRDAAKPSPRRSDLRSDKLPRLEVLTCRSCGAPLPLSTADQRCASCGAPYAIPADYASTLALRSQFAVELKQAETTWRRVHWTSSIITRPVYGLSTFCAFVGLLGLGVTSGIGLFSGLLLFGVGVYFATLPRHVPPLPRVTAEIGRPELARCTQCGAPVAFAPHDLSAACRYCGAENYRPDYAQAARASASGREAVVASSLYDAVVELRRRVRNGLKTYICLIATFVFVIVVALGSVLGVTGATIAVVAGLGVGYLVLRLFAVF